jgi:hypothetical protein
MPSFNYARELIGEFVLLFTALIYGVYCQLLKTFEKREASCSR